MDQAQSIRARPRTNIANPKRWYRWRLDHQLAERELSERGCRHNAGSTEMDARHEAQRHQKVQRRQSITCHGIHIAYQTKEEGRHRVGMSTKEGGPAPGASLPIGA